MSKKKKDHESRVEQLNDFMTNNQKLVLGGLVILIVLFGLGIFFVGKEATDDFTRLPGEEEVVTTPPTPTQIPYPTLPPVTQQTVALQDVRFNPGAITVERGAVINFLNLSSDTAEIVSTDHPDIVVGSVEIGDVSENVTLSEPGTYTFTNESNNSIRLVVTVR